MRCHEWIDGEIKLNEQTSVEESRLMGKLVAHLHGLCLPWSQVLDYTPGDDEPQWAGLALEADRRRSGLAPLIHEHLATLETLEDKARQARRAHRMLPTVGSHRDLNAHNVLFSADGLQLI